MGSAVTAEAKAVEMAAADLLDEAAGVLEARRLLREAYHDAATGQPLSTARSCCAIGAVMIAADVPAITAATWPRVMSAAVAALARWVRSPDCRPAFDEWYGGEVESDDGVVTIWSDDAAASRRTGKSEVVAGIRGAAARLRGA